MKIDACFQLGHISGTRGLHGEIQARLDSDRPEHYKDLESVFLLKKGENSLVPFFIESLKIRGDHAVVKFEEVSSKDEAKQLIGSEMYLPLDQLPKLDGDSFYYHELLGWRVMDENLGELGKVSAIHQQTSQILLVMEYQHREVLIPFTDDIVLGIDREHEQVNVLLPDGLLEIYLEE